MAIRIPIRRYAGIIFSDTLKKEKMMIKMKILSILRDHSNSKLTYIL
jgi:hypothetical protein